MYPLVAVGPEAGGYRRKSTWSVRKMRNRSVWIVSSTGRVIVSTRWRRWLISCPSAPPFGPWPRGSAAPFCGVEGALGERDSGGVGVGDGAAAEMGLGAGSAAAAAAGAGAGAGAEVSASPTVGSSGRSHVMCSAAGGGGACCGRAWRTDTLRGHGSVLFPGLQAGARAGEKLDWVG